MSKAPFSLSRRSRRRSDHDRRAHERTGPSKLEDLLFDAFYSAAIGGCVLALFFLLVDVVTGEVFRTPSLMGSVLFLGVAPETVTEVRLDMVAYFTMVHMAVFGVLGILLSVVVYETELHSKHPARVFASLLLIVEGGSVISANVLMPGLIGEIGFGRIFVGNILTVSAMALFMLKSHNPRAWDRLLRAGRSSPLNRSTEPSTPSATASPQDSV